MKIRQNILDEIVQDLSNKRHSILMGARQVGKTTLVKQLLALLKSEKKNCFYFTLEDPHILRDFNAHPEKLFDYTSTVDLTIEDTQLYVIIDEIQYLSDPTNFLKLLFDKYAPQLKIIATGSSAFYIDKNFKDSLAGRKKLIEVYPLDFEEFIAFKNQEDILNEYKRIRNNKNEKSSSEQLLRSLFNEFLTFGGYPAVVLESNFSEKRELLAEYVNSYIKKDILEANLKDDYKIFQLLTLLSHQAGALLNTHELANTLQVASGTMEKYLYLLKKGFHIQNVMPKFGNIRKELSKMPKVYFNDLGLRNHLCRNFEPIDSRPDKGVLIENYAYLRLKKKFGIDNLRFWRTIDGHEVDFVIEKDGGEGLAFEIKYNFAQFNEKKYTKFLETYPDYSLKVLSYQAQGNAENDIFLF